MTKWLKPRDPLVTLHDHETRIHNLEVQATGTSGGTVLVSNPLEVKEIDGAPDVTDVRIIRFSNGSVTDDGSHQVTVTTSGGGGGSHTHDGAGTNSSVMGGVAEAGAAAALADAAQSVAVGDYSKVDSAATASIAIGGGIGTGSQQRPLASSTAWGAIVIGSYGSSFAEELAPYVGGYGSIVIGLGAKNDNGADNCVTIGQYARSSVGGGNVSIGYGALTSGTGHTVQVGVAIGDHAFVGSTYGVAIGQFSQVSDAGSTHGSDFNDGAMALGTSAWVGNNGTYTQSIGAMAIGYANGASSQGGAIGRGAISIGARVGLGTTDGGAWGDAAIAIGSSKTGSPNFHGARARADMAIAIGGGSECYYTRSVSLGSTTIASDVDQVAIGPREIEVTDFGGDPAAGASSTVRIFAKDDGGGTIRLYYVDGGGTVRGPL